MYGVCSLTALCSSLAQRPSIRSVTSDRAPTGLGRAKSAHDERPVHERMDRAVVRVSPGLRGSQLAGLPGSDRPRVEAVPVVGGGRMSGAVVVRDADGGAVTDRERGGAESEVVDLDRAALRRCAAA